ncbi:MAG: hypothetical protein PF485_03640 [Bacteroidales bacterium]|jgi:hypothetical protein|nr:hypothetical protein [Bacteroidales bacterium]
MLTKKSILFFLITLLATSISAQYIKNKQFSLYNYNLTVSKDFVEEIIELESFIDNIKTYNDPGNEKLNAILVHIIYYNLKDKLTQELEIEILPINTFMREVKYDDNGYPKTNIRNAIRKGDSRYYFKVEAQLESLTKKKREESPELFIDIDYPVTYPELTITITVNNKEGIIPVAKWIGTTTPKYPLAINKYLLKGFDNTDMIIEPAEKLQKDNLYLMLDRAIYNTIQDHINK